MKDPSRKNQERLEALSILREKIRQLERSVSELKQAEEESRKLASVVRHSRELVNLATPDGRMVFLNDAGKEMLGLADEDLPRFNITEVIPDHLQDKVRQEVLPSIIREGFWEGDLQYRNVRTGGLTDVHAITYKITDPETGETQFLANVSLEITERKQSEEALRKSEERYRLLIEHVNEAILVIQDGAVKFVNSKAVASFGYSEEDFLSTPVLDLIHPEDRDVVISRYLKKIAGDTTPTRHTYRTLHKTGRTQWIEISSVRIEWEGRPATLNLITDVTERRKAEEALRQSEERYRTILEEIEDGYQEVDLSGNFTFFNESFRKILGYREDELLGSNFRSYAADEANADQVYQAYNRMYKTGNPIKRFEWDIVNRDGARRTVEFSASLLMDGEGHRRGFRGIVRDVTDRRLAEENLQKSVKQLRRAMQTTIQVLLLVVETKDPYTSGHQKRTTNLARAMAEEMHLSPGQIEGIRMAGVVHDIGKIAIPTEILSKPTRLSEIEFSLIKGHVQQGYEILKDVESPWPLAEIVYQHHERMDGSGYPRGLKGEEILIEARILSVADVVEAMASNRPYRPALGIEAALEEIEKHKGVLYDPAAVDTCVRLIREKGFKLDMDA